MKYWLSPVGEKDDFGSPIDDIMYDAKSTMGPWGLMSPKSFRQYGVGLGTGLGQKYEKQADGKWLKTDG